MRLERFGKLQNEKYRGYVSDIHSSGGHLLVADQRPARPFEGRGRKLELDFTSVNLTEVTDHAMRSWPSGPSRRGWRVAQNFPADLPNVVADLRSMRQIMINLCPTRSNSPTPAGR